MSNEVQLTALAGEAVLSYCGEIAGHTHGAHLVMPHRPPAGVGSHGGPLGLLPVHHAVGLFVVGDGSSMLCVFSRTLGSSCPKSAVAMFSALIWLRML